MLLSSKTSLTPRKPQTCTQTPSTTSPTTLSVALPYKTPGIRASELGKFSPLMMLASLSMSCPRGEGDRYSPFMVPPAFPMFQPYTLAISCFHGLLNHSQKAPRALPWTMRRGPRFIFGIVWLWGSLKNFVGLIGESKRDEEQAKGKQTWRG